MRLLIRISGCTSGMTLSKLKLTQSGRSWLDHRLTHSAALRRKTQPAWARASSLSQRPLSSPGPFVSVLFCSHTRTVTHTPVAFASSSAASTPTPAGSVKTQADTENGQTSTSLPLDDVKRILRLAHPERWRLAGTVSVSVCVFMW